MISDHITYLKSIVEDKLVRADGTTPFKGKFFELYPQASKIKEMAPCAALRHLPGGSENDGTLRRTEVTTETVTRIRQLYKTGSSYQVDLYSRNIYDFFSSDGSDLLSLLIDKLAQCESIIGADGNRIDISLGAFGFFDDESLIVDNVYKAFCRVTFDDGVYKKETVAKLPTIENIILEVEHE